MDWHESGTLLEVEDCPKALDTWWGRHLIEVGCERFPQGLNGKRYCTQQYLGDTLRHLFERRDRRHLAIHSRSHNTVYLGAKIEALVWDFEKGAVVACFTFNSRKLALNLNDIKQVHILY